MHLEDGRTLPTGYRQFDYGYAVTAHRSQGKTVDVVVIAGETLNRELFYVAASRARDEVTVITSDKLLLQASIERSAARQSASELARSRAGWTVNTGESHWADVSRGVDRGFTMAVRALQAAVREWVLEPFGNSVRQQDIVRGISGNVEQSQQLQRGYGLGL